MTNNSRRFGRLVLNIATDQSSEASIPALAATPQRLQQPQEIEFPCAKNLIKRQHSLKLIKHINIQRVQHTDTDSRQVNTRCAFKTSFEENKILLEDLLSDPDNPRIDLKNTVVAKLVVDTIHKAIKTKAERQLILRVFMENCAFVPKSIEMSDIEWIVDEIKCESFLPNQVVYETGDFGQQSYLVLTGEFNQLLPESEELITSPMKINKRALLKTQTEFPSHSFNRIIRVGDAFGETEVLSRQRRQCTIICKQSGQVMRITKESFTRLLGESKDEVIRKKTEFLSQFPFFAGVSNAKLMALADSGRLESYNTIRGTIYEEGDAIDTVYFIVSGQVQISTHVYDEVQQHQQQSQQLQGLNNLNRNNSYDNETSPSNQVSTLKAKMISRRARTLLAPIMVIGENSFFGIEEIMAGQTTRQMIATTISEQAQILVFNTIRLINLVKTNGDFTALEKSFKSREQFRKERIDLVNEQKSHKSSINIDLSNKLLQQHSTSSANNSSLSPKAAGLSIPFAPRSQTPSQSGSGRRIILPQLSSKFMQTATASSFRFAAQEASNNSSNSHQGSSQMETKTSLQLLQNPNNSKQQQKLSPSISPQDKSTGKFFSTRITVVNQNPNHASLFSNPQLSSSSGQITLQVPESKDKIYKRERFNLKQSMSTEHIKHSQILNQQHHSISKTLFSSYIKETEEKLQMKQEILSQMQAKNNHSNKSSSVERNHLGGQGFFNQELQEGFNQMYLRKFGRKYNKQM